MFTHALHDTTIEAVVLREVTHVVARAIVNGTHLSFTLIGRVCQEPNVSMLKTFTEGLLWNAVATLGHGFNMLSHTGSTITSFVRPAGRGSLGTAESVVITRLK